MSKVIRKDRPLILTTDRRFTDHRSLLTDRC
jgi:hypothetical protein